MSPLILFALFASGLGWSVHKKRWGVTVFFGTIMLWMIVIEIAIALMSSHSAAF